MPRTARWRQPSGCRPRPAAGTRSWALPRWSRASPPPPSRPRSTHRLWDVGPDGRQAFVTRVAYRPRLNDRDPQVFQLHPNGWHFAPQHIAKLELVGADSPYVRAANASFTATVSDVRVRLPVRERMGGPVKRPARPLARDGAVMPRRWLARELR